MKAIRGVALLALFTGAAPAQMVTEAQTGHAITVIVSEPSQTCDEAKWRLEENMRMARKQAAHYHPHSSPIRSGGSPISASSSNSSAVG